MSHIVMLLCRDVSQYVVITRKQWELHLGSHQWPAFSCGCHSKPCFLFSHLVPADCPVLGVSAPVLPPAQQLEAALRGVKESGNSLGNVGSRHRCGSGRKGSGRLVNLLGQLSLSPSLILLVYVENSSENRNKSVAFYYC